MHKKFLVGQSLVGYAVLFDMAAVSLVALAAEGLILFLGVIFLTLQV